MTDTSTRNWTPQRPSDFIDFDGCECTGSECRCFHKVELPLRAANGRTVRVVLTLDEAEALANQLASAVAMGRALDS